MTPRKTFDRIDLLDMFQALWASGITAGAIRSALSSARDALDPDTITEVDAELFHNVLKRLGRWHGDDQQWFVKNGWIDSLQR